MLLRMFAVRRAQSIRINDSPWGAEVGRDTEEEGPYG